MQNKVRSVDLEIANTKDSYVVIDGVQAARLPHRQAEALREQMIQELAASHEAV